jgi:uncharacterized protein YbaA (DUF1428 family)
MPYVDGFLIPVPKKNLGIYQKMAVLGRKMWMKHGALEYRECIGDDLKVKWGMPFTKLLRLKPGETAVFSWIVYKSKAHRNAVNAKVMKDPLMNEAPKKMPFDMKKMCYGGFKIAVEA